MLGFSNFHSGLALVDVRDEHPATSLLVQHHCFLLDVLIDAPPFLQSGVQLQQECTAQEARGCARLRQNDGILPAPPAVLALFCHHTLSP